MDLRRLLRSLIVTEIVLVVVFIAVDLIAEQFLPAPLRAWVDQQTDHVGPVEIVAMLLALPLLATMIVSWVGLWRLWRPARWIYLIALLAGVLLEALLGPWVYSGPGAAVDTVQSAISGIILALVFFTPLAEAFERPSAGAARGVFEVNIPPPRTSDPGDTA